MRKALILLPVAALALAGYGATASGKPGSARVPASAKHTVVKTRHGSLGTFLVDGAVAGTWRYDGEHVRWEAFGRLDRASAREVDEEAARLAGFHR